ncbi:MAG: phosphomethylpyrimidine synthase ThiC [Candidatus Kaelpia imicola]|nr:phosphomethylpyrimidine synthase ThiC [Candidatus Kaelpia imicola]
MTLIDKIKKGDIPLFIKEIANFEEVTEDFLLDKILKGRAVIPDNEAHSNKRRVAIGEGMNVKINVNIGTSLDKIDLNLETRKIELSERLKADTIMDLSVGGDIAKIRRELISKTVLPFGTVPLYEAAARCSDREGSFATASTEDFFEVLEGQAREGVDFFTIHAGITADCIDKIKRYERELDIVSRGGALMLEWMIVNERENPFYEYFDRVLEITKKYDVTISLGDALRPGSIFDAGDSLQYHETFIVSDLVRRARDYGVQTMVEGPGHVPLNKIEHEIKAIKEIIGGAPLYVLGPLIIDSAAGYDHINAAIGASIAAYSGADFLCYLTPAEHLSLPDINDVRDGIMAFKIAAQAVNFCRGKERAVQRELKVNRARKERDWEEQMKFFLDSEKASEYHNKIPPGIKDTCSMCSKFCSIKIVEKYLNKKFAV